MIKMKIGYKSEGFQMNNCIFGSEVVKELRLSKRWWWRRQFGGGGGGDDGGVRWDGMG